MRDHFKSVLGYKFLKIGKFANLGKDFRQNNPEKS